MELSITWQDYLLHHSHNLRPFLVNCGLNIVLFTFQLNNNYKVGFSITESIYKDISFDVSISCGCRDMPNISVSYFFGGHLGLCKLNHVPPFIFSYTFFCYFNICKKQIALETFLLQLVVG